MEFRMDLQLNRCVNSIMQEKELCEDGENKQNCKKVNDYLQDSSFNFNDNKFDNHDH